MSFECEDCELCACQKVTIGDIDEWQDDNPPEEGESFEDYFERLTFNTFACSGCETCVPAVQKITQNIINEEDSIMHGVNDEDY